ncbi:ATP-binding protein, partial [Methylogaea oryzae]|uniref:ATP-binding protein n=1 Tax=Methylogaea oryzae TaxID=1295382 RepID=UPI0012E2BD67
MDRQGRIVLVNDAYCGFFHRRREDLLGSAGGDIGFDDGIDLLKALGEDSLNTARVSVREGVYVTAKDEHHHIQVGATPCFRADGSRFVVGVVRDVTQQRHAVERIEEAQLAAESASAMKSQFLANMSHEIRSPMNGIIGIAELLADTPLDHEQQGYVQTIERSAQALLGIINDILDFSKIEAGKMELERIPFDPGALAENCAAMVAPRAYEKALSLVVSVDADTPPQLLGDPTRLTQILVNFLTNAVKFTFQGEVVLRVESRAGDDGGVILRFAVSDSGIGISSRQLDRLFMPFMQADASTTRRYGGTGLGLSICKRLAELMDGGIGPTAGKARVRTFWVELPFGPGSSGRIRA